jgi:hypothetical protein
MNADKRGLKTNDLIRVHPCSSAANIRFFSSLESACPILVDWLTMYVDTTVDAARLEACATSLAAIAFSASW